MYPAQLDKDAVLRLTLGRAHGRSRNHLPRPDPLGPERGERASLISSTGDVSAAAPAASRKTLRCRHIPVEAEDGG